MIPRVSAGTEGTDSTDGPADNKPLNFDDMTKAIPKGASQRQQIKTRDWKSSVAAYNDL